MKECFKCGAEKPLFDFYKHKQMKDGHLNKCKECTKKDVRARRFDPETRGSVLEYDRNRGSRQTYEDTKAYRLRWPEKYKARQAVCNAVRTGRLIKPESCETCGEVGRVEGHHDDYSKPLEVRWLCSPCHHQHHAMEVLCTA